MSQMLHLRWNSFQNQIVKNDFCIIKMMTMSFYFIELFWFILIKFVVRNGFKQVSLFEECVISIIQVFYGVLHVIILVNFLFPNDKHNWSAKFESFFLTPVPKKNLYILSWNVFLKKENAGFQYIHSSYCRINHTNHNNKQFKIPTVYFLWQRRTI